MEIIRPGSIKIDTCTYQLHSNHLILFNFILPLDYWHKIEQNRTWQKMAKISNNNILSIDLEDMPTCWK